MDASGKRLNKYISDAGVCSRREADRLIERGEVEIIRHTRKFEPKAMPFTAGLGEHVYPGDTVIVKGRELPKKEPEKVYYVYNKPTGVICTADRNTAGNIMDATGLSGSFHYAGRLDKDSSGLILMTNDGDLNNRMMRASSGLEKEYICGVDRPLTDDFIAAMAAGVKIRIDDDATLRKHPDGIYVTTNKCKVRRLSERTFSIVLTQGLNRQIRRMVSALGYSVTSLKRVRVITLRLGDLKPGEMRKVPYQEIEELKRKIIE